ncbi:MAG: hypothetical protein SVZ03_02370 [Spirochaetota bacterium]|nr:hypothetical protein [Spirochaetota bacterium]
MKYGNRWYDKNPELSELFEQIKECNKRRRDEILLDVKNIIVESDPELIDRHVMEFSLDLKRRWYDKDPISWMIINGLKYADDKLIEQIVEYYRQRFKQ